MTNLTFDDFIFIEYLSYKEKLAIVSGLLASSVVDDKFLLDNKHNIETKISWLENLIKLHAIGNGIEDNICIEEYVTKIANDLISKRAA